VEPGQDFCPACEYLWEHPYENNQVMRNGETEGFANRRWQFYFHRGEL